MTTQQPKMFPACIVVFCDRCGARTGNDYWVHDLMTRDERLAVARGHLNRNEGWSCTAAGDLCPACRASVHLTQPAVACICWPRDRCCCVTMGRRP